MTTIGFLRSLFENGNFLGIPRNIVLFGIFLYLCFSIYVRAIFFKKAGKKAWYALIPVLNNYHYFDLCWHGWIGVVFTLTGIVAYQNMGDDLGVFTGDNRGLTCVVFVIIYHLLDMVCSVKMVRSFNKTFVFAFGLMCFASIFLFILTRQELTYLGPTLRKYNPVKPEEKHRKSRTAIRHKHMVELGRSRSIIALISGNLVFALSVFAIVGGILELDHMGSPAIHLYRMFTTNANTLSALGAVFMIPYAIEGIRKKRFTLPKWVSLVQYAGALCTTLTMVFALVFIWPVSGTELAVGGYNFYLHIICPIFTLILLFTVESGNELSLPDCFICSTPFYIYTLVYILNVAIINADHGGWEDLYRLAEFVPISFSLPGMYMLSLIVALVTRQIYNRLIRIGQEKLYTSFNEYQDKHEILTDIYGLGLYNGVHDEINGINIPFDLFAKISEHYGFTIKELSAAFSKGCEEGLKSKVLHKAQTLERFKQIFGTPEKLQQN